MHCKYYTYFFLRCILYVWRKSWTLPRFWPWSHRSGVRQQQRRLTMSSGDFVVYWGISVTHGWWPWSTKDGSRNIHIPQFRKDCWEYLGTSCSCYARPLYKFRHRKSCIACSFTCLCSSSWNWRRWDRTYQLQSVFWIASTERCHGVCSGDASGNLFGSGKNRFDLRGLNKLGCRLRFKVAAASQRSSSSG